MLQEYKENAAEYISHRAKAKTWASGVRSPL